MGVSRRKSNRKSNRKNRKSRRGNMRKNRMYYGGGRLNSSLSSLSRGSEWASLSGGGGNPRSDPMIQSLDQGKEYLDIHKEQHGGGGSTMLGSGSPYPGEFESGGVLPQDLRASARMDPLDKAYAEIRGMSDQSGGGKRNRKNKKSRKNRMAISRKNKRSRRRQNGGFFFARSPAVGYPIQGFANREGFATAATAAASTGATKPPATTGPTKPPASMGTTKPPASTGATKAPASTGATKAPATPMKAPATPMKAPASTGATKAPATPMKAPASTGATKPPAAGATKPPASTGATKPPAAAATKPPAAGGTKGQLGGGRRRTNKKNRMNKKNKKSRKNRKNRMYYGGGHMGLASEYAPIDSPTMLLEGGPTAGGSGDFSDPWLSGN